MVATQVLGGITAITALITLPAFAYYFGLTVPMVYDVQMQMAHRSFFDAIFCVTPTSAEMLAPSLAGFAAAAGVMCAIAIALTIGAGVKKSKVTGCFAGIAFFAAGCCAATAIALAMYEGMVLDQTISAMVHNIGIGMGVLVGITAIGASATFIASFSNS